VGLRSLAACAFSAAILVATACSNFEESNDSTPLPEDCPEGQSKCDGTCIDTTSSDAHCGRCETACAPSEHCKEGHCLRQCGLGLTACGAACSDLTKDDANCGACGKACDTAKEECRAGACVVACKKVLNQPITDPWGTTWDGLERAPATFADAKASCEALNGRLPLPSELYRVSATKTGAVGQSSNVDPLWSLAPHAPQKHVAVRLSDAEPTPQTNDSKQFFRCTCPPDYGKSFGEKACFGPADKNACVALPSEGKRYALDAEDRIALPKGPATWECAFLHARLATPLQYLEAMTAGAGTGSGKMLHAADDASPAYGIAVAWTDPTAFLLEYTANGMNTSWFPNTTLHPFRCAGPTYDGGTHPATIAGEFVGAGSRNKADSSDNVASALPGALASCWTRGGHIPLRAELLTLVGEGLPNGSFVSQWTFDQTGYDSPQTQYTVGAVYWTGAPSASTYQYAIDEGSLLKTTSRPFRCLYYPVDAMYSGPSTASCAGGCFEVDLPGTSGAKMWFDTDDRSVQTLTDAAKTCIAAGGRVASNRDYTEAIRAGLVNGSDALLWTSDLQSEDSNTYFYGSVLHWSGTDAQYTDLWGGSGDQRRAAPSAQHAYRCMWTNELR